MRIEMTGLADIVRQHASQRPDAAAIVHAGRTTTYGALDRASNRVANGLIAEGIGPQVRVAHLDKSSDIFFELLFGGTYAYRTRAQMLPDQNPHAIQGGFGCHRAPASSGTAVRYPG